MTVAVLGEALVDFIVSEDGSYRPHLGGSPYNVAVGLARQGVGVSYLSPLSNDSFGEELRQSLVAEGVHVPLERRSPWPTSLALITTNDQGQPAYRLYRDRVADRDTSFDEVVQHLPEESTIFHTGSLALTPGQLPLIRQIVELTRKRGILISMDLNIRLGASTDDRAYLDGVWSLLKMADIVKASDEDLRAFSQSGDPLLCAKRAYAEMGKGLLVFTRGGDGAMVFCAGSALEQPAYPVSVYADTIGAGDTFHSAFLAFLYRSGELAGSVERLSRRLLENAIDYSCAAAAINVSRSGCAPPNAREVSAYMAQGDTRRAGQT